jgi:hypothetical protein
MTVTATLGFVPPVTSARPVIGSTKPPPLTTHSTRAMSEDWISKRAESAGPSCWPVGLQPKTANASKQEAAKFDRIGNKVMTGNR